MAITSIGPNDNSKLYTVASATAVGGGLGYVSKFVIPITKQEDTINRRAIINYCRKITNKAKIDEFEKKSSDLSSAQEAFKNLALAKVSDNKEVQPFSRKSIKAQIDSYLGGEDTLAAKELKGIIREVNSVSKELSRRFARAYAHMLKDIRPTAPFIVTGAGVGFFAGFVHNIFKTDFDA